MRRRLREAAIPAALLTVLFGFELVFQPLPFPLALRAWLVGLAALAAGSITASLLGHFEPAPVAPVRFRPPRAPAPERPPGLDEVERAVDFASWNGADLNRRLRPLLREVAGHRLWSHHGLDLERRSVAARSLLGEPAWSLVAGPEHSEEAPPARPATEAELDAAISRLEEL